VTLIRRIDGISKVSVLLPKRRLHLRNHIERGVGRRALGDFAFSLAPCGYSRRRLE
jgi:hypothetical protein